MVKKSLALFPELKGRRIFVALDSANQGSASQWDFCIYLNPENLSYFTIGHELTHLVQFQFGVIPKGEVQCDIYTIARHSLFLDARPNYLDIGGLDWNIYKHMIQKVCRDGIKLRNQENKRRYIYWIKKQLIKLEKEASSAL